ncbi:MAG TPA: hypothetical protein VN231_06370 [Allosphingosinicella sp.]|nr:hypothetical protein [Allosphingosinicella sp.]
MRKLMLLAGAAALAAAMPALAKEQGQGRGGGRGQAAHAQHKGGGHARAERGRDRQSRARERGGERRAESRGRGNDRAERRLNRQERRVERAIQDERRQVREARRVDRRIDRRLRADDRPTFRDVRREDRRDWREWTERRLVGLDRDVDRRRFGIGREGCPPGLARQNRFCMPPGQLRRAHFIGQRLPVASLGYNIPDRYRYRFVDNDRWFYRYDDAGFVYRFERRSGFVSTVVPLFGSSLTIGEPLPLGYEVYNLPLAYRSFYPDRPDYFYRYDDNAIYQVDRETNLVEGIVALLAGGGLGGLGVGDRLPTGYSAYNVPIDYRDTYFDTDDAMYRYADNAIYQVDPETRLIEAVISLLT